MRVLPAIEITDAMLTYSSVAETDASAWSGATAYVVGDVVRYVATDVHKIYQCIANHTNKNPYTATDTATYWSETGPTNRWKMFDLVRSTGTTDASPVTVILTPSQRVDSIALVGLVASSISVDVTVDGSSVYAFTEDLSSRGTVVWSEYFFSAFSYKTAVAKFDIPPFVDPVITITVSRTSGDVTVGGLLIGRSVYIGATQYDAVSDALNFSSVTRDFAGTTASMVQRRSVPKTSQRVVCDRANVPKLLPLREVLNATPALWSGLDDADSAYFEPLLILGFYRQFSIALDRPNHATVTLELEEV